MNLKELEKAAIDLLLKYEKRRKFCKNRRSDKCFKHAVILILQDIKSATYSYFLFFFFFK